VSEPPFPRQEHRDYLERRARRQISKREGLRFIDIVDGFDDRTYCVGVEKPPSPTLRRLPIAAQLIQHCLDEDRDDDLLLKLDVLLDEEFAA